MRTSIGIVSVAAWGLLAIAPAWAAQDCPGGVDTVLAGGTILTVDAQDRTAHTLRLRGDRIVALDAPFDRRDPCLVVIDLAGRTVIPGLIDNHTHFLRTAQAPGPLVEGLESAASIPELLEAFRVAAARAEPGEWIAAIGGFTPGQFTERRLPTRAELSAAVPTHPVYLQVGYSTRGLVNDEGRRVLAAAGITTSEAGDVATDGKGLTEVLRSADERRMRRRFPEYLRYAVSLGLTTVVDHACCDWLGAQLQPQERPGTRIAEDYWRAGQLPLRLRLQYDHRDIRAQADLHSATARLANATRGLGDDYYKVVRFGEQSLAPGAPDDEVFEVFLKIAEAGWGLSQHTIKQQETERYLRIMERVAARRSVRDLRWTLEHVFEITPDQVRRLQAIGVGVRVQSHDYIRNANSSWNPGPPYRMLLESGIRMGAGSDSAVVGALNPWLGLYFMVTGRDASGTLLLPGQQVSRREALRLYTAANAWFNFEEGDMGSLEVGKLADLVVLDKPYLDCSDDELRRMRPLLTMTGGRVVHAIGPYAALQPPALAAPARPLATVRVDFNRAGLTGVSAEGWADRAARRPVTIDDPVRVASISKLVVGLGVMRLVEQGVLDLDRDVGEVLGWPLRHPVHPAMPITLRMLLSHRSGLTDDAGYVAGATTRTQAQLAETKAWDGAHAPGTHFRYANLNLQVVAAAMERATHERFDQLMQHLVLQPLGLEACFNWDSCSDEAIRHAVVVYRANGEVGVDDLQGQRPSAGSDPPAWEPGANGGRFSPQGGLRISARGLATLGRLLLGDGEVDGRRLLQPSSMAQLRQPLWQGPTGGESEKGFFCRYGLALQTLATRAEGCRDDPFGDGVARVGHAGDAYGLLSGLWVDLQRGEGVAYFITGGDQDGQGRRSAFYAVEEAVLERR